MSALVVLKGHVAIGGYTVVPMMPPFSRLDSNERLREAIGAGGRADVDLSDDRRVTTKDTKMKADRGRAYEVGLGETKDGYVAYTDLASMSPDLEGVLEFAGRWGHLGMIASGLITVSDYYCAKIFIAGALASLSGPNRSAAKNFITRSLPMLYGPDRLGLFTSRFGWSGANPYLYLETNEILQFCLLDLILQHTGGGRPFARCPAPGCGEWLHRRGWGRPQEYCSDSCRVRHSRARKRARGRRMAVGEFEIEF
jgi:hypothetical protein